MMYLTITRLAPVVVAGALYAGQAHAFIPTTTNGPLVGPAVADAIIWDNGVPSGKCLIIKQAGAVIGTVCGDWQLEQFKFDSNGGDITTELQPPCPIFVGISLCGISIGLSVFPDQPPLPPGTPKFTQAVKDRFKTYSYMTKAAALATSTAAAIASRSRLMPLSFGFGALAAVLGRFAQDQLQVANDPFDPNYNVAVKLVTPLMPDFSTAPTCVQKLANHVAKWSALAEAAHTAYNRTYSAASVGDQAWTQKQATDAVKFANTLDADMTDRLAPIQVGVSHQAQKLFLCNDMQQASVDPTAIAGILQGWFANGYPVELVQALAAMGINTSGDLRPEVYYIMASDPVPAAYAYNAMFGTNTIADRAPNWNQFLSWTPDYIQQTP